jgi:hypothetical protein
LLASGLWPIAAATRAQRYAWPDLASQGPNDPRQSRQAIVLRLAVLF